MSFEERKIRKSEGISNRIRTALHGRQKRPQVRGPIGSELDYGASGRMAKGEESRMQGLARREPLDGFRSPALGPAEPPTSTAAVDRIPDQRMADVSEVDSDLVGPSTVQL